MGPESLHSAAWRLMEGAAQACPQRSPKRGTWKRGTWRTVALQGSQGLSGVAGHGNVSPTWQAGATALAELTGHLFQE